MHSRFRTTRPSLSRRAATHKGANCADFSNGGTLAGCLTTSWSNGRFDGVNAELAQHYGLRGNQVPVAMLREWGDGPLETRAVTSAPADVGSTEQHAITPYVFPAPAAMFLGIEVPTVGVGEQTYPYADKRS